MSTLTSVDNGWVHKTVVTEAAGWDVHVSYKVGDVQRTLLTVEHGISVRLSCADALALADILAQAAGREGDAAFNNGYRAAQKNSADEVRRLQVEIAGLKVERNKAQETLRIIHDAVRRTP